MAKKQRRKKPRTMTKTFTIEGISPLMLAPLFTAVPWKREQRRKSTPR